MKYQVCIMQKTDTGNAVKSTHLINAVDLPSAYAAANADPSNANADLRIYPFCTMSDGDAITELAKHTITSFEKWERRNNYAVMNPGKRTPEQKADYTQDACLVIFATLKADPSATMYECKSKAFTYISTLQKQLDRKSEREYNQDWIGCNITPRMAKATYPQLDRLMRKAVESADLTEAQMTLMNAITDGYTPTEYIILHHASELDAMTDADRKKTIENKRKNIYTQLAKIYWKILSKMVELDEGRHAFTQAGFNADDIDMKLEELAKRGRMKR